jgi:hypothetical protein
MRTPKRMFENLSPGAGRPTVMLLYAMPGMTDEELATMTRGAVRARAEDSRTIVAMGVGGFDDDPRELYDIPEARAFLRRLVDFGVIAALIGSTQCPELGAPSPQQAPRLASVLGGFEVWLYATGRIPRGGQLLTTPAEAQATFKTFTEEVLPAAAEAMRRNLRRYPHTPEAG